MAGINRLGKAPPRPGSLRPPDPNRNRILDIFSEGTEGDADYNRMVQDIEDVQQSQVGWLFGRGAFDKGDLLYLRDEEEKRRFKEEELRDSERAQFLRMQASSTTAGPGPGPGSAVGSQAGRAGAQKDRPVKSQARLLANLVRVKSGVAVKRSSSGAESSAADAVAKRPKASPEEQGAAADGNEDSGAGLAGLIGDYGSDEEEDDEAMPARDAVLSGKKKQDALEPVAAPQHDRQRSSEANGGGPLQELEEHVDYD